MNRRKFVKAVPSLAALAGSASGYSLHVPGQPELQPIVLPQPEKDGGKSVLASLLERKTTRINQFKGTPDAGNIQSALGCFRGEPRNSRIRQKRKNSSFSKQFSGNRPLRGFARRCLHL